MSKSLIVLFSAFILILSGCASGTFKARQEQRDKLAASTGMYCEFISGDLFPDLDVELSMQMAKRCDANKSFTVTNYKNSSSQNGVIYCCSQAGRIERKAAAAKKAPAQGPAATQNSSDFDSVVEE